MSTSKVDVTLELPGSRAWRDVADAWMRLSVDWHVLVVDGKRVKSICTTRLTITILLLPNTVTRVFLASARRIHRLPLRYPDLLAQHGPLRIASDLPLGQ
jgi:hypothetical protein